MYRARKPRSVPMLLPHSGAVDGFVTCCFTYSSAAFSASATLDRRLLDLGQQPRLRVHLAHEVVHPRERLGVGVHDEFDAVVEGVRATRR